MLSTYIANAIIITMLAATAYNFFLSPFFSGVSTHFEAKKEKKEYIKKHATPKQQVIFATQSLASKHKTQAKKEFDKIMAIPAYARKEMNINYPACA